ncbi:hypothetical protein NMG60_11017334 [Bertholletia excelsa]
MLQMQLTNQIESVDDDVVICSPRGFVEAREKARRDRQVIEVIDEDSDPQRGHSELMARSLPSTNSQQGEGPAKNTIVSSGNFINLESNLTTKDKNVIEKPVVPTFYCLVCMGQLREETSTKCGHIFCRECIHSAIAVQGKCPTCRRIIGIKDTFRVYLPASN